jgi:lipopolysaccharide export system permease protein
MRLLDRYLLVEWLKAFGLALAATLGVLLLADMYGNISDLLSYGAHPREVFYYYRLLLPGFMPAVIPLSQLVSLLFVFGNLHRNNEITAMRAAGLSLWRIARPFWIAGALLALLLGWLDAAVVPWSVEAARTYRDNLRDAADRRKLPPDEVGLIPQVAYDNSSARRHWFINSFSDASYRAVGVSVYELDVLGHDARYIFAREGYFDPTAGDWVLEKGREIFFDPAGGAERSTPFDKKEFTELRDSPSVMLTLRRNADSLSLNELIGVLGQASNRASPAMNAYAVRYYAILAKPFICLIVVGLAIPFAVAGVRVSPMVGVSKAVGLFFANYVVSGVCTHLGDQHDLPALVAAWLPIALMCALAAWLFRRAA